MENDLVMVNHSVVTPVFSEEQTLTSLLQKVCGLPQVKQVILVLGGVKWTPLFGHWLTEYVNINVARRIHHVQASIVHT